MCICTNTGNVVILFYVSSAFMLVPTEPGAKACALFCSANYVKSFLFGC